MGIHRPDTVIVFLVMSQKRYQCTRVECRPNVIIRQLDNTNPLQRCIQQGSAAVTTHISTNPDIAGMTRILKSPVTQIPLKAIMVFQLRQRVRGAMDSEISW